MGVGLPFGRRVPTATLARRVQADHAKWGGEKVAREQSAAGARRASDAKASMLAGSVEEANESEHLEGSLAHLTFSIVCSGHAHRKSEARRARIA